MRASTRTVYLPQGTCYDFNTNHKYEGGKAYLITMSLDQIPMFIRDNIILPLAEPLPYIMPSTVIRVNCRVYGTPTQPIRLLKDNSTNFDYKQNKYNWVTLAWEGKKEKVTYLKQKTRLTKEK